NFQKPAAAGRGAIIASSSTESSGSCSAAPAGAICQSVMARGKRRMVDCPAGAKMALGIASSASCDCVPIERVCSTGHSGISIPLRSAPPVLRPGEKSRIETEPPDHALGLSHGGIGTKLHLATEGNGLPIGFVLTVGNRNECPTFEPLMRVAKQCRSRCRWPKKLAADKGYSADKLRR